MSAPSSTPTNPVNVRLALPLFRVGLLCRVGIGKGRDGHAGAIDAHDTRIRVKREVEGLGRRHLRDQTNVRDARPVAITESPARRMFSEQRLHRLETRAKPMLDPGEPLV